MARSGTQSHDLSLQQRKLLRSYSYETSINIEKGRSDNGEQSAVSAKTLEPDGFAL